MSPAVEDINKSGQEAALAEKIASWDVSITNTLNAASSTHSTSRQRWKLLCPIWPQVVASINDVSRKIIQRAAVSSGPLTTREGGEAVRRRASLRGLSLSVLGAEIISQTLGNDPLLIALHEPDDLPRAERVIGQFIDASVGRVSAQRGQYTASDYRTTLRRVAQGMLESRDLNPTKACLGDQSLSLWKEDSRQRILPPCQNLPICGRGIYSISHPSFEGSIAQVVGVLGRPIG